jgi:hypothetical protein
MIGGKATGLSSFLKGNAQDPNSLQNRVKHNVGQSAAATASSRFGTMRGWTTGESNSSSRIGRGAWKARRGVANTVLGLAPKYAADLDRRQAEQNEKFDKFISQKTSNGNDNLERAFFAKKWDKEDYDYTDYGGNARSLKKGRYYSTYRDAEGKYGESSSGDVAASHSLYDNDEAKAQTLIKYELGKVSNDAELYGVNGEGNTIYDPSKIHSDLDERRQPMGSFLSNLPTTLRQSGLNQNSAAGATIGAFYSKQGERRELKHTKLQSDGTWKQSATDFVQDFAENVGSYSAASGKTSPVNRLTEIQRDLATKTTLTPTEERAKADLKRIALALDTRMKTGGPGMAAEDGAHAAVGGSSGGVSGGAGRTNEAIQRFVHEVNGGGKVYDPALTPVSRSYTPR